MSNAETNPERVRAFATHPDSVLIVPTRHSSWLRPRSREARLCPPANQRGEMSSR